MYYGDGISAKDLSEPRFKKSRADQVTLGAVVATSRIHDIQGAARSSPLVGQSVADVPGIVTALRSNGVYFEDPQPDANPATSEGGVRVHVVGAEGGSWRRRAGQRSRREFRSGGATGLTNLTGTEIDSPSSGNVETSGVFDPDSDALDFYEKACGSRSTTRSWSDRRRSSTAARR